MTDQSKAWANSDDGMHMLVHDMESFVRDLEDNGDDGTTQSDVDLGVSPQKRTAMMAKRDAAMERYEAWERLADAPAPASVDANERYRWLEGVRLAKFDMPLSCANAYGALAQSSGIEVIGNRRAVVCLDPSRDDYGQVTGIVVGSGGSEVLDSTSPQVRTLNRSANEINLGARLEKSLPDGAPAPTSVAVAMFGVAATRDPGEVHVGLAMADSDSPSKWSRVLT